MDMQVDTILEEFQSLNLLVEQDGMTDSSFKSIYKTYRNQVGW